MTDKPQPNPVASALSVLFLLGIVGVIVYACSNSSSDGDDTGDGTMAEIMCEEFVTERLKAPSTADFPGAESVLDLGADEYEVTASVDSENGFGAMIRTEYVCTIQYTGGDQWQLVSLDINE